MSSPVKRKRVLVLKTDAEQSSKKVLSPYVEEDMRTPPAGRSSNTDPFNIPNTLPRSPLKRPRRSLMMHVSDTEDEDHFDQGEARG